MRLKRKESMKKNRKREDYPNRVVIIGSSGCGKTTLAKVLSSKWGLAMCDLDELAWMPNWIERDRAKERADVEKVVANEKWVIAGNYSRHRDLIWVNADLIIWLDLPLLTCLWRGFRRSIKNILLDRSLCNGNYDSFRRLFRWDNRSIIYWIYSNHKKKRMRYLKLLDQEKDPKLPKHIHLRTRKSVKAWLRQS